MSSALASVTGTATIRAVDAFAGAGGLSLGLGQAGIDVVYSFDLDDIAIATQRRNPKYFGHESAVADINDLLGGELLRTVGMVRGELDLLAGGPPCQGFSVQRGKATSEDPRNALVASYARLIDEVFPRVFIMENVPGLAGDRANGALDPLWETTARLGYEVHKRIIDAADYGVPQRRKRFVVIGVRGDVAGHFEWPGVEQSARRTVRETIDWLPTPTEATLGSYPLHRADKLSALNVQRIESLLPGQGRDHLPEHLLAECHRRPSASIGHRNVYGRMDWDDVAPTITARFDSFTRGKFGHPEQSRSISLLEGALLQTFPADFAFEGNKVEIARQIGNAVPPRFARELGRSINNLLNG
jgi:DNA (cytosine-5)-methyltransferase 1